jgi:hypothetical protein
MKKIFLYILLATILFANEQNYIEIGGGSEKLKNNFSPESRKTIIQLNEAQDENESFPYFEMYYGHNLNDTLNLYVSSDINGAHIGSLINSDFGVFDFGLKFNLSKEWKNPFFRLHFQYGVHLLCGQKEHRHHQNLVCRKTYFLPGQRPVLHQADNGRENHFCENLGFSAG